MGNQNTPLFSVIVPVYNVSKYLSQCIESVLNQEFRDFELILVDDGSSDNSGEICDRFQQIDDRVHVIHKKNGGVTSARNTGIWQSVGEYVFYLDGDDYIEMDILDHLSQLISRYHPDIVSFGYRTIDEKLRESEPHCDFLIEGLYEGTMLEEIFPKLLYDDNCVNFNACSCIQFSLWSKVFKKELLLPIQLQIPMEITRGEDAAAVMTAVCRGKSLYVAQFAGYNYRIQNASVTHTFKPGIFPKLLLLLDYLEKNASHIPLKNIRQFAMTEIFYHTKDAVSGFEKYADYKNYINGAYTDEINLLVKDFDLGNLALSRKLQIIAIKRKWWLLYWLVYR